MMGHGRTVRGRSALGAWLTVGALLAGTLGAVTGAAQAADGAGPLAFVKYIKSADLTGNEALSVGVDVGLGKAVFYGGGYLELVDTDTLIETSAVATGNLVGNKTGFHLDSQRHVVYISGSVPQQTPGCSAGVPVSTVCTAAAAAGVLPPKIETVDLRTGQKNVVTLPPEAAGQQVVAMAAADPPNADPILYALLFSESRVISSEHGVASSLTLYALDTSTMPSGASDGPAKVLWSYPVNSCASLVSASSTQLNGGNPEFLGVDPTGGFVYFACRGLLEYSAEAHLSPDGAVVVSFPKPFAADTSTAGFSTEFYPNGAAAKFGLSGGDSARTLLYIAASTSAKSYMRVFNATQRAWTGSLLFQQGNGNLYGLATASGSRRAYLSYGSSSLVSAETAQLPVDQGSPLPLGDATNKAGGRQPLIDPVKHRIFLPGIPDSKRGAKADGTIMTVVQDTRPVEPPSEQADPDEFTHQVEVTPDTQVGYSAFATAYGAKAILFGAQGLGERGGLSPAEAAGTAVSTCNNGLRNPNAPACVAAPGLQEGTRSMALGQVDVEASNSVAKAKAVSVWIDDTTQGNASSLSSTDPAAVVLFSKDVPPRPDTPDAPKPPDASQQYAPSSCGDFGGDKSSPTGPGSAVACDHDGQQARAAATSPAALTMQGLEVASAASATSVGRTPDNRVLTLANAYARGISISVPGGPSVTIGEVTATAESRAAGRTGSAWSRFTRTISDVEVKNPAGEVVFSCGFAKDDGPTDDSSASCDPRQLTAAVNPFMPFPILFLTPGRDKNPLISASPGGAQAEVIKSLYQYWNDYFTAGDVGHEVPGLQIVFVGDQDQPTRLTLDLAGVLVESHDTIGPPPPPPPPLPAPTLTLSLVDGSTPPVPLSGGSFTIQGPTGTEPRTCLTAADGVGTCKFTDLTPGNYTIHEVAPPPGFAAAPDYETALEAGTNYKTTFVNLAAIGSVRLTLLSPGDPGAPLADGVFALHQGSSTLGMPVATCTTDAAGTCGFDEVPLGDYTMQQVSAPSGYLVSEDVGFTLTEPGQLVRLTFVDGIPGEPPVPPMVIPGEPPVPPMVIPGEPPVPPMVIPGKPPVPPKVIPGKPPVPPRTVLLPAEDLGQGPSPLTLQPVGYETSSAPPPTVQTEPSIATPSLVLGDGAGAILQAPAQLARLFVRSREQAFLLLFVWFVLGLPVYLWVRRRQFITATERA